MRFDDVKPRFWDPSAYATETFATLTRAAVDRAETVLEVKLPREYLELLELRNGGYVADAFTAYPTARPTSWAEDHVWFRTLAGIGPHDGWPSVTYRAPEVPLGLVVLSGDVHYMIALDYRRDEIPSLAWIDLEVREDLTLAPDFRSFVEGLAPVADFEEDDEEPRLHIARPGTDSAYCGYQLTERLSWVAESQVTPETSTCTDCERLQSEWQAVRRRT